MKGDSHIVIVKIAIDRGTILDVNRLTEIVRNFFVKDIKLAFAFNQDKQTVFELNNDKLQK